MAESEDLIELESKHRKEKRELQAQIQALKRAAKNDKTKKKELIAEIARLESEQEQCHKNELDSIDKQLDNIAIITKQDGEIEMPRSKVSKAQKRRDKKEQQEKDRQLQIKIQEAENLLGPRNTELRAINAKLKARNLQIYSIPSDGDCLYNAIAHQLSLTRDQSLTVDKLRMDVATYIRKNKDDFLPFLTDLETFEMLSDEQFDDYCDKIEKTKTWGGQLEIRALSSYLMCPITVIQAAGPDSIEQGIEYKGQPLVITYHRHMYSLGEHFNSTQMIEANNDS